MSDPFSSGGGSPAPVWFPWARLRDTPDAGAGGDGDATPRMTDAAGVAGGDAPVAPAPAPNVAIAPAVEPAPAPLAAPRPWWPLHAAPAWPGGFDTTLLPGWRPAWTPGEDIHLVPPGHPVTPGWGFAPGWQPPAHTPLTPQEQALHASPPWAAPEIARASGLVSGAATAPSPASALGGFGALPDVARGSGLVSGTGVMPDVARGGGLVSGAGMTAGIAGGAALDSDAGVRPTTTLTGPRIPAGDASLGQTAGPPSATGALPVGAVQVAAAGGALPAAGGTGPAAPLARPSDLFGRPMTDQQIIDQGRQNELLPIGAKRAGPIGGRTAAMQALVGLGYTPAAALAAVNSDLPVYPRMWLPPVYGHLDSAIAHAIPSGIGIPAIDQPVGRVAVAAAALAMTPVEAFANLVDLYRRTQTGEVNLNTYEGKQEAIRIITDFTLAYELMRVSPASGASRVAKPGVGPGVEPVAPAAAAAADSSLAAKGGGGMETRTVAGYKNPEPLPQRPFEADYPNGPGEVGYKYGPQQNEPGTLKTDIEGRPLQGQWVVGRRVAGGADEALPPAELDALGKATTGGAPQDVAPERLPKGTFGGYSKDRKRDYVGPTGAERSGLSPDGYARYIRLASDLDADSRVRILGHEIGHAINDRAGSDVTLLGKIPFNRISGDGLSDELRSIYNDLHNPDLIAARARTAPGGRAPEAGDLPQYSGWGPEKYGYHSGVVQDELWAEAVRSYLADPNYIKTVAPNVARAIRAAVNSNPQLSKIINFNTIVGGAVGAGTAAVGAGAPPDKDQQR